MSGAATWRSIEAQIGDAAKVALARSAASAFSFAQLAYNAECGGTRIDGDGAARGFAVQYVANFDHIAKDLLGGVDERTAIAKLQVVSDWLVAKGWFGVPKYAFGTSGAKALPPKSAAAMHTDMLRFAERASGADRNG